MKNTIFILLLALFALTVSAQEKPKKEDPKQNMSKMMQDSTHQDHSMMKHEGKMEGKAFNKYCPIKGGEIDHEVATVEYNGKNYGFCCPGCDKKFKENPEKYSKNLSEDGQKFLKKDKQKAKNDKS